ncbi:putative protein tyrosine kinase [Lyophyllum shimeji]|uniref:non-specific serine/threonine protein kinase n=1 Tax=Lyophyllum shimeji TaxID=47721 RepID=A0A9P3PGI3_LYOSH|nr:putative protein tyrosine kinase [Lyophyllum shimeji]
MLHPSPPSSVSSSHSGSSQSRWSFLSSSSSSTFSDISVSSLPSPPHSGSKTHAFFASPFPTRPPSPTPAPPPPSTKTYSFFAVPTIDVSTPTIKTPTTQSIVELDSTNEPTPRPKDLEPDLTNLWLQPTPNEPTAGSIISSQNQIAAQPSPTSAALYPLSPCSPPAAQNTTLRLQKLLGRGAFSSVWLADDLSPVPLVLRSRRSLRDLRRQASLKSPPPAKISNASPGRLSLSRAGSLRKLRARVPGTSPIRSLVDSASSGSTDAPDLLPSSLSRASSASSTSSSESSTKPRALTISITEPTSPPPGSGGLSRSNSVKGRLVAVKMTVRGGAGVAAGEDEEREKERTRVAFVREVEVLRHISHPNITPLLTHLSTPTHHVLVLPYLPGGDLLALVNTDGAWTRLRESVLQRMWCELCRAVGWMHGVGLVHRDIKLENILLTTEIYTTLAQRAAAGADVPAPTLDDLPPPPAPLVKLTDFGLSRFVDIRSEEERVRDRKARRAARRADAAEGQVKMTNGNGRVNGAGASEEEKEEEEEDEDEDEDDEDDGPLLSTRCGSEAYAAPELVTGGPAASARSSRTRTAQLKRAGVNGAAPGTRGVYDARETDAWACGVVLYALVARRLPFGEGVGGGAGAGAGFGNGAGIGREGETRTGAGEGRMARRAWLMRIARGEYEWPEVPPPAVNGHMNGNENGKREEGREELMGPTLAASEGAKRIVGRLLVRDPRKRARVAELWRDVWMGGDGEVQVPPTRGGESESEADGRESPEAALDGEEEEREDEVDVEVVGGEKDEMEMGEEELERALAEVEEEVDEFGWLVDQDSIDDIARREVV